MAGSRDCESMTLTQTFAVAIDFGKRFEPPQSPLAAVAAAGLPVDSGYDEIVACPCSLGHDSGDDVH